MKTRIFFMISVTALFSALSACGGGGGTSDGPAPAAPVAPKPVIVDAEGDSTIHGYNPVDPNQQSPNNEPAVLQNLMQGQFGPSVTVVNSGVNGAKAIDSLDGIQPMYAAPFAQRLAAIPAQLVIGNYAINDSRGRTTDQYATDLTNWVAVIRAAGRTPILEEPNPVCDPATPNLDSYVPIMRYVAQQSGVLLIQQYDYIKGLPDWQKMLTDCLHPNDALYAIKAQREAAAISGLVSALR